MTHIPYRGTGPALTDLLAGRTQAFSAGTPALLPHIRSGKLRAIATGTPQRLTSLPDLATVAESGYPGFESVQWYGVLAPGATPPEIVKRIQEECPQGAALACHRRTLRQRGRHHRRRPAGGVRRLHRAAAAAVERHRPAGRDQGGLRRGKGSPSHCMDLLDQLITRRYV